MDCALVHVVLLLCHFIRMIEEEVVNTEMDQLIGIPGRLIKYAPFKLTFFKYLLNIHLEKKLGAAQGKKGKGCCLWTSPQCSSALAPTMHTTAA